MKKEIIKKNQVLFFVIGAYFFLLYFMFYGQAQLISLFTPGKSYTAEAIIGFGTKVKEEEIQALLERYNVMPISVSVIVPGLDGTIQSTMTNREGKSADLFLKKIRTDLIADANQKLQFNRERIRYFLETHSEDEIAARNELKREVRNMLFIHSHAERKTIAMKRGDPVIYAMEVLGDSAQLERMSKEKIVKAFKLWINHDIGEMFPFIFDENYNKYNDPAYRTIRALSWQEAYQQSKGLMARWSKDGIKWRDRDTVRREMEMGVFRPASGWPRIDWPDES